MSADKNKCFSGVGVGAGSWGGFYFHRQVGVKLSAEGENKKGGDKGRNWREGCKDKWKDYHTSPVGGEEWDR